MRKIRRSSLPAVSVYVAVIAAGVGACAAGRGAGTHNDGSAPRSAAVDDVVLHGRMLVLSHGCGDCHGGMANPAAEGFLAGTQQPEMVGPFSVWPRNLTPHAETGLGRATERQIYNALRYGLRPSETPDVDITSDVPGQGNHPARPNYLAPAMPWVYFRSMPEADLRAIAAYLKRGLRPVEHAIPASEGPPDHWAGDMNVEKIGGKELPPFPTEHEELHDAARRTEVLQGRALVAHYACSACHGGALVPTQSNWLTGARGMSPPTDQFQIGPFKTYPRNLTPDNRTGLGRFTERQIFNALRYGLRPGETPDVEITSHVPGQGNHPERPKYLAPPMPWFSFRHMSDDELRAIAAYLKHGLKPVDNRVMDSEGPPDFWAGEYTADKVGTHPAPPFPTARERASGS
jgi:mono/diheme cytochrome c family protein